MQKDFTQAAQLFEQTISLKPNWSNAHYTYAWALYQNQQLTLAVKEMETAISLLDPKKNQADYKKAQADLALMKEKSKPQPATPPQFLPEELTEELLLPTPPTASLEPKLDFPEEATPEAQYPYTVSSRAKGRLTSRSRGISNNRVYRGC